MSPGRAPSRNQRAIGCAPPYVQLVSHAHLKSLSRRDIKRFMRGRNDARDRMSMLNSGSEADSQIREFMSLKKYVPARLLSVMSNIRPYGTVEFKCVDDMSDKDALMVLEWLLEVYQMREDGQKVEIAGLDRPARKRNDDRGGPSGV